MPIHLAVLQSSGRPLKGLCTQLQAAGHDVLSHCTSSELLGSIDRRNVDVVMVDARSSEAKTTLKTLEKLSAFRHVPVMLITTDEDGAEAYSSWSERIDDIVLLPVDAVDLKNRLHGLGRLTSMTLECMRRRDALSDFGIARPAGSVVSRSFESTAILFVGPADGGQVGILETLRGRMTASYAIDVEHAIVQLDQTRTDVIMATSSISATDLRLLVREVKSRLEWCDLPIVIIADAPSEPILKTVAAWGEIDFLPPSTHPTVARLRLQILNRQWRLRRQLRGMVVDRLLAPVIDGSTGLYGHGFFHHYVDKSISDHRRRHSPLTVAVCTLGSLSKVNELGGYPAGDRLLHENAVKLAGSCRAQDLVARIGGCSFGILLNDTSTDDAAAFCYRLTSFMNSERSRGRAEERFGLSITFGMSEIKKDDNASTLIGRAAKQASSRRFSRAS